MQKDYTLGDRIFGFYNWLTVTLFTPSLQSGPSDTLQVIIEETRQKRFASERERARVKEERIRSRYYRSF